MLDRAAENKDGSLRSSWSQGVLGGLDRKLSEFESALRAFRWPAESSSWFTARMVVTPEDAAGKIGAAVLSGDPASPRIKLFSGGFDAKARATLAAGSYAFDLEVAGRTKRLGITVRDGDSWGDVLGGIQRAVNGADMAVRAEVLTQAAPFTLQAGIAGTGCVLALSVAPEQGDQSLRAQDHSGILFSTLRMSRSQAPAGPAQITRYDASEGRLAVPAVFSSISVDPGAPASLAAGRHDLAYAVGEGPQPGTYLSKTFAPGEASTLAPGEYSFASRYNGETRPHTVRVGSGWTWGDVLGAVAAEINAQPSWNCAGGPSTTFAQPGVSAEMSRWNLPPATPGGAAPDGRMLAVTGRDGADFSLSDTSGALLGTLGLASGKLTGTPVSFTVNPGDTWKDVFSAASTALNGAQPYLKAETQATRMAATNIPGLAAWKDGAYLTLTQQSQTMGGRISLGSGSTGVLETMGIASRQSPPQEGGLTVNARRQASAHNTFVQDGGRIRLSVESSFADSLPLSVTSGLDAVESGWGRITEAWNSLSRTLRNNGDLLDGSLAARLEAPLQASGEGLLALGVSTTGKGRQIWTQAGAFWKGLAADPAAARETLWQSPDGLVPAWLRAVEGVRTGGLERWLAPATAFEAHRPTLTSEFELEQKHRLLQLLG